MTLQMKWIKAVLPLAALAVLGLYYWPGPSSYLPSKLWGVWKTDAAPYADRYLDISEAIFTIGQGRERLQVLFLDHVVMKTEASKEHYTLYYRASSSAKESIQAFRFDFFMTEAGPRIQLKNPRQVNWYREARMATDKQDRGAVTQ